MSISCNKCQSVFNANDNYCSKCGEPKIIRRIDKSYIFDEIQNEFLFEKGYFYTLKCLLLYPSNTINTFLNSTRGRIVKPILFLFISTIIFVISKDLIKYFFPSNDDTIYTDLIIFYLSINPVDSVNENLNTLSILNDYYAYSYLFLILIMSAIFAVLFEKLKFNYFEIVLAVCYIISVQLIIILPFDLIILSNNFLNEKINDSSIFRVGGLISSVYSIWALTTFFKGKSLLKFMKVFFGYYFSFILFSLLVVVLTMIIYETYNLI